MILEAIGIANGIVLALIFWELKNKNKEKGLIIEDFDELDKNIKKKVVFYLDRLNIYFRLK